ncbi:MAG: YeeE/YedE family protein [bacterium]
MLILNHLEPLPFWLAGLLIGAITLALLWLGNQRLGISTGFENVCALVLRAPYFQRSEIVDSQRWRLPFLGGLVLGGFVSAALSGGWAPFWDLGMFDARIGLGPEGKLAWMFGGGALIGLGTRMAGGCTSGHSIFGISNLERASLESTVAFLGTGILTCNLIYRVIWP